MTRILQHYRLSEYMEVFILLILGMVFQIVDGSPFSLKARWKSVWDMEIPKEFFSVFAQNFIKTVLSLIVVARCSTTYLYVLSSLLVMACILTNGAPKLLLPWLLVAGVKSVCLTLLETIIGMYVCSSFGRIEVACIEFIIQKAVEMLFASFLWLSILNMYNTMIAVVPREPSETFEPLSQETVKKADLKKRRARSLIDESTLSKTAKLNYFEFKDVPKILMDMLRKEEDLSQDSLIAQGMMVPLASVSNMGSFDNLKTSQSLGELGSIDLKSFEVVGLDDVRDPPVEKALKFMKLSWDDIKKAKRKQKRPVAELYNVDESVWEEVKKSKITINRTKITRPEEVFVRDFHRDDEPFKAGRIKRRSRAKSIDSRAKPDDEIDYGEDEDESIQVDTSEAEEHLSKYMIMSNLKEEGQVFRIRLESAVEIKKAHKYADLYRQPHMSVIGPEVFDNACKLRKLTPLNTDEEKEEKVQRVIERDDEEEEKKPMKKKKKTIYFSDEVNLLPSTSSFSRNEKLHSILSSNKNKEIDMAVTSLDSKSEESQSIALSSNDESATTENESICNDSIHCNGLKSFNEAKPTSLEKKEVFENKPQLPEVETPKENQKQAHKISSDENNSNVHEKRIKVLIKRYSNTENSENIYGGKRIAIKLQNLHNKDPKDSQPKNKQVYFITELLHKPVSTCLKTLYEINSKSPESKLSKELCKNEKTENIKDKWKSTVLKNMIEAGDVQLLFQSHKNLSLPPPALHLENIKKLEKFNKKHPFLKQEKNSKKSNLPVGAHSLNNSCPHHENNNSYKSPEESSSDWSLKSNESFSLYYSKAANLASPLFDVRRFIYPDRIHYSYQNMKNKEGFDVEISGELPLIVRESLTFNPYKAEKPPPLPESNTKITRRPMDLSFALNDQNDEIFNTPEAILSEQNLDCDSGQDLVSLSSSDDIKSPENEKTERLYSKLVKLNSKNGDFRD